MTLLDKVAHYCNEHALFTPHSKVIVGLSGGPDSVALVSILHTLAPRYAITLLATHLNHQWRQDALEDEEFSRSYAQSLNIPFIAQAASIMQAPTIHYNNGSQEENGRTLRRLFFEETARTYGAHSIALGHHEDDQQETFFLRLLRGASVAGLSAMKPKQGLYVRPLLSCSKDELLSYLKEQTLSYREDSTNNDPQYLRNAIRHTVIPALKQADTRFSTTFRTTLESLQETDSYLAAVVEDLLKTITHTSEGKIYLHRDAFLEVHPFLHPRILIVWLSYEAVPFTPSISFFNELVRFLKNSSKKHNVHSSWSLIKEGGYVRVEHTI